MNNPIHIAKEKRSYGHNTWCGLQAVLLRGTYYTRSRNEEPSGNKAIYSWKQATCPKCLEIYYAEKKSELDQLKEKLEGLRETRSIDNHI